MDILYNTLSLHCLCNLKETCNVSTCNIVAFHIITLGSIINFMEDINHDLMKFCINFVRCPGKSLGVLAHFQTGGGDAAGVGSLARRVEQAGLDDRVDGLGGQRHVRAFEHGHGAVFDDGLRALEIHLVLGRARHGDVARHGPDVLAALDILSACDFVGIDGDASSSLLLDVEQNLEVDAVGIIDVALGVAHCNDLAAELDALFCCVLSNIAGAGDNNGLTLEGLAVVMQNFVGEVADAVAGSLGTSEGAAIGKTLAGQDAALKAVNDLLVLAVHEADLTSANTDAAKLNAVPVYLATGETICT